MWFNAQPESASQMVHLREHELKRQQSKTYIDENRLFILFATHRPINELIIREHKQQIRGGEKKYLCQTSNKREGGGVLIN